MIRELRRDHLEITSSIHYQISAVTRSRSGGLFTALETGHPVKGFRLNPLKPQAVSMLEMFGPDKSPAPYAMNAYIGEVKGNHCFIKRGMSTVRNQAR